MFCLNGMASTKIRILSEGSDETDAPVAQWQFEVGDHQSPGCHFHVGVGSFAETTGSIPVPRLPSILVTPIDALDFLLGEIFQVRWKKVVNQETSFVRTWAGHQKERLSRLLEWKQDQIKKSSGSAWNFLKHSRPHAKTFLKD
jgi:hypothetical protein